MAVFLARSDLSRGDLRLFLTNGNGYPQNAFNVRWTVFRADGSFASGKGLPAVKADAGEYYAPWCVDEKNGCYNVLWEYQEAPGCPVVTELIPLFVVNVSSYDGCGELTGDAVPEPGCSKFLTGTLLGRGDLPLFLTDPNGFPSNAFGVFWTIFNAIGNSVTEKNVAVLAATGEYYAQWLVTANSGDYTIKWEWMEAVDAPFESKSREFGVVNPPTPYAPLAPYKCFTGGFNPACDGVILAPSSLTSASVPCAPSPCPPVAAAVACSVTVPIIPPVAATNQCCPFEIPRTVHLPTGPLPLGGAFTDQPAYKIPEKIRNVTFYGSYVRGAPGGFPVFRLLWGNGVEETQETMIDMDFEVLSPAQSNQDIYLQNLTGPVPDTDAPVNFILHVCVPGGATCVRLIAAEKGATASPGTLGLTLTAAS